MRKTWWLQWIVTPPHQITKLIGTALAKGARRANLRKAIVLSSVGAQHASGTGVISTLHQMEALLANAAPAIAFLRPGYYVETWSESVDAVLGGGALPTSFDPDLKIPMVSTVDVGLTAAELLNEDWTGKRVIELAGLHDWSARDVSDASGQILGRPVVPACIPVPERAGVYAVAGVDAPVAAALLGMYDGLANGRIAREGGNEDKRGSTPLPVAVRRIVESAHTPGQPMIEARSGGWSFQHRSKRPG